MIRRLDNDELQFALPTGRLQRRVLDLLNAAGIDIDITPRNYRPRIGVPKVAVKCLKPQSIPASISIGSRDLGFCGADWAYESGGALVELLDTGFDPVNIVVAAPKSLLVNGKLPDRPLIIASEYQRWPQTFVNDRGLNAVLLATRGTTEVLPPEDADLIVDNTATGATLIANDLEILEVLFRSSTRLYANPVSLANKVKRAKIESFVQKLRKGLSVMNATNAMTPPAEVYA
jgi:ATP phosphoribosyltransferase